MEVIKGERNSAGLGGLGRGQKNGKTWGEGWEGCGRGG